MASVCDVCGKGPGFGNNISHSHRRTRRRPLKAERRQTFLIFCGLVGLLALLVLWLLSIWLWQWPG